MRRYVYPVLLGLGAVGGFVVVWLATARYGIGVSPDSVSYISAARNLLVGEGLVRFDGLQFVLWPPLFPALLALIGLPGIDPLLGSRLLNAAAFGLSVPVAALLLRRCLQSRALAAIGTVAVLSAPPLLYVATKAWTEPVFVLLALSLALFLSRWLETARPRDLVLAVVAAALLPLDRYIGAALVPVAALAVLLWRPGPWRGRVRPALLLLGVPLVALGAWLLRNHLVAGAVTGQRIAPSLGFAPSLELTLHGIAGPFLLPLPLFGLVALAALALPFVRPSRPATPRRLAVLVALAYVGGLLLAAATTAIDGLDSRMTAVLYPFLVVLFLSCFEDLAARLRSRPVRLLLAALAGFWLILQANRSLALVRDWRSLGAGGYSLAEWQDSPTAAWLRENPVEPPVYSNAPDAAYILAGVPARLAPTRDDPRPPTSGTLVWFSRMRRAHVLDPAELARLTAVEPVVSTDDGGVLRFRPRY